MGNWRRTTEEVYLRGYGKTLPERHKCRWSNKVWYEYRLEVLYIESKEEDTEVEWVKGWQDEHVAIMSIVGRDIRGEWVSLSGVGVVGSSLYVLRKRRSTIRTLKTSPVVHHCYLVVVYSFVHSTCRRTYPLGHVDFSYHMNTDKNLQVFSRELER